MKQEWRITPSEKAAERARREQLLTSHAPVQLGETVFSLQHFLNRLAASERPVMGRRLQRHLLNALLKNRPLRYFEKLGGDPLLAECFQRAIVACKRFCITPEALEEKLKQSGSLKENDLLVVFKAYEKLKKECNVVDEEDQYFQAIHHIRQNPTWLQELSELTFENFISFPEALNQLITALQRQCPELEVHAKPLQLPPAESLSNTNIFSLNTPHQEIHWFIENFIIHEENPSRSGILITGKNSLANTIWQKLKQVGLAEGPSPFLSWGMRPEGKQTKGVMESLDLAPASLSTWIEQLQEKLPGNAFVSELQSFLFAETVAPLGALSKEEFGQWLHGSLAEIPSRKIPESLEGIQWLSLAEGDFPSLDCLWVPHLTQDAFQNKPLPFFQDKKDRSLPEWKELSFAFPTPQELFHQTRVAFFNLLKSIPQGAWLTYPLRRSLGQDLSPSPLTWYFDKVTKMDGMIPTLFVEEPATLSSRVETLKKRLGIERERWRDKLLTKDYHANFLDSPLNGRLPQQKEDHVFSASQLEKYGACPFKYYAEKILNIPQSKDYSPDVDYEDRGTLFHNAMEQLLSKYAGLYQEALMDRSKEEKLYLHLKEMVAAVFQNFEKTISYPNSKLLEYLQEKTFQFAKEVLHLEIQEAEKIDSPLIPHFFEWGFSTKEFPKWNLKDPVFQKPIHLQGRIDRIDLAPKEKRFLVLDYKTGTTEALKGKILDGLSLQIPLYILAVKQFLLPTDEAIGGLLISVREGKRKHGMVQKDFNQIHFKMRKDMKALVDEKEFQEWMEKVLDYVREYAGKIRLGFFSPQPKECERYCHYKEICRYANKP